MRQQHICFKPNFLRTLYSLKELLHKLKDMFLHKEGQQHKKTVGRGWKPAMGKVCLLCMT